MIAPMDRMRRNERQIYLATYAMVHGMLMASKALREKPLGAARLAKEHAEAAVEVHKPARKSR
jgi:hypothetical protein